MVSLIVLVDKDSLPPKYDYFPLLSLFYGGAVWHIKFRSHKSVFQIFTLFYITTKILFFQTQHFKSAVAYLPTFKA